MKNKRSQEETESASDKRPTEPVAKAVHDFFLERWTNNLIGVQIWIGTPPFKRQWTHSPPDPLVRDKNPSSVKSIVTPRLCVWETPQKSMSHTGKLWEGHKGDFLGLLQLLWIHDQTHT